ncbi:hydroxymethylbilane synthase [Polluticoccus soli]|uniref:hydroxymethylbilane synthase n=1 Tax=Polluticoccus soli TaxID=3034150 RepID=UPI0023E2E979|nr:hydroxymethylbilane synthase [Flavipsychrobacter sp. JY13-12]
MNTTIRIGTRDSALALWQANEVKRLLAEKGFEAELVLIKSEGDINLVTPLYEMGVQGVFTRTLDIAMLNGQIDVAVHSMKDVPTQLPTGIVQAAVLPRASHKDLFVPRNGLSYLESSESVATIATSSIRRKAQWMHRFPNHTIESIRGNVNTRLRKVEESNWQGAIFAAAGLERIDLRPGNAVELDWMLPAPAQGAIMVVCREDAQHAFEACSSLNDAATANCVKVERDFLRGLMGGCSMPISALAEVHGDTMHFEGNVLDPQGTVKLEIKKQIAIAAADTIGILAAQELLTKGAGEILSKIKSNGK